MVFKKQLVNTDLIRLDTADNILVLTDTYYIPCKFQQTKLETSCNIS